MGWLGQNPGAEADKALNRKARGQRGLTARPGGGPVPETPPAGSTPGRTPKTWLMPPLPAEETNFKRFGIK